MVMWTNFTDAEFGGALHMCSHYLGSLSFLHAEMVKFSISVPEFLTTET